jgi:hypothetical protein
MGSKTLKWERDSECTKKAWRGQLLLEGLGRYVIVLKSVYLAYFLPVHDIFRIAIVSSFTLALYVGLTL